MRKTEFIKEKLNEWYRDLEVEFVDEIGSNIDLSLEFYTYDATGNICIVSKETVTGEPYARLTVNVGKVADNEVVADTNNFPLAGVILSEYGIAENTYKRIQSGFCSYPIYRLIGV